MPDQRKDPRYGLRPLSIQASFSLEGGFCIESLNDINMGSYLLEEELRPNL